MGGAPEKSVVAKEPASVGSSLFYVKITAGIHGAGRGNPVAGKVESS